MFAMYREVWLCCLPWCNKKLMSMYSLLTLLLWFCNSFNFNGFYETKFYIYMHISVAFIVSFYMYVKYVEGKKKHSDGTSGCLQLNCIHHSWCGLAPSTSHVAPYVFYWQHSTEKCFRHCTRQLSFLLLSAVASLCYACDRKHGYQQL